MQFNHPPPPPPNVRTEDDFARAETSRARVLALLRKQKATTNEINAVGGSEGTRRLRELRAMGYRIDSCRLGKRGSRLYWLIEEPK